VSRKRKKKTAHVYVPPPCPLCTATRLTPRVFESDYCWVADCLSCQVPMVVFAFHEREPHASWIGSMLRELWTVASDRYGQEGFVIDVKRGSIPGHWHAHARPNNEGSVFEFSSTIEWVTDEPPAEEPLSPDPLADECENRPQADQKWWESLRDADLVEAVWRGAV